MKVLVNALSVSNMSGRHVLLGHLSQLSRWTRGQHEYYVLHHHRNSDLCRDLGENVRWVNCPPYTSRWASRAVWERIALPHLVTSLKIDFVFMPSGTVAHGCPVPQISFAQNPWCLVKGIGRTPSDVPKAAIQRREYRVAMREAAMMVFNSEYMRSAYRENADFEERYSEIVYQGIDNTTLESAAHIAPAIKKDPYSILSVSAMAPHKGVDTVIKALERLIRQYRLPVRLSLVGPWPDDRYERKMRNLISELRLQDSVKIAGFVSRERLHQYYAESGIFCLMSQCESFGIPAVEAQAFGTPVVSSNCCAIPEVCGEGGVYCDHDDIEGVSSALSTLLTDEREWKRVSAAAVVNASRFRWDICSMPLLNMFKVVFSMS